MKTAVLRITVTAVALLLAALHQCISFGAPSVGRHANPRRPTAVRSRVRRRAPAHGARSGCSRSAARVARLPKAQFAPSPQGIICSPCLGGLHHEYSLAPSCA